MLSFTIRNCYINASIRVYKCEIYIRQPFMLMLVVPKGGIICATVMYAAVIWFHLI